ncbi:MAG: hypothetical protein EB060_00095 [Proteobacteria bacterium]|nr:hypothetical protein [Pseudomonadota bacterium]
MPKNIRLSGTITDSDSPELRKVRAEILYHLFLEGWNIYNGNGDQAIHLWNIQRKIDESHGFVFLPGATIDDVLNSTSIFVGYQTGDMALNGKPTIMMNSDKSWTSWLNLLGHLHERGTVSQHWQEILTVVNKPQDVVKALKEGAVKVEKVRTHQKRAKPDSKPGDPSMKEPSKKVCVFCSASTKEEQYLKMGYKIGQDIARNGFGCVTGAGRTGIMGEVVRGGYEAGGWTGGSNVPHIIEMEGLPDGLNQFWPRDDIYTRMEVMIQKSNAFVILPGGMGTVQELLVLLQLKKKNDPLLKKKPIVLVNASYIKNGRTTKGFWNPMISLAEQHGLAGHMDVVEDVDGVIERMCL